MEPLGSFLELGIVGLFAAFVIYSAREMRAFVEGRDKQWKELLIELTDEVKYLADKVAKNTAILVLLYRDKSDDSAAKQLIEEFLDECSDSQGNVKNAHR